MKKYLLLAAAVLFAISCTPSVNPDHEKNPDTEQEGNDPSDQNGNENGNQGDNGGQGDSGSQEGWDGKTFIDRSGEWTTAFVDKGGWWAYEITSCTAKYHLIKYIMEGEDFLGASEAVRKSPIDIAESYKYWCVNVDESYLLNAMTTTLPDMVELAWPDGYGHAHGYVFGFDENKQFTGEYVHLESEKVF